MTSVNNTYEIALLDLRKSMLSSLWILSTKVK